MAKRDYDLAIIGAGSGGLVAADFAARLGIRPATVRNHVQSILRRLGASSRLQAVLAGLRAGWLHA